MSQPKAHAYSQALIDAWERFAADAPGDGGPITDEFPGLVENLFVISCGAGDQYAFRNVGAGVERLFGRDLVEHDFLSLWTSSERPLVTAAARRAVMDNGPVVMSARAASLGGQSFDLEFTLAPIRNALGEVTRLLGLCQPLATRPEANTRPIGEMRLEAVYPPSPAPAKPHLRLVVCNA